jgi:hypothetical protein
MAECHKKGASTSGNKLQETFLHLFFCSLKTSVCPNGKKKGVHITSLASSS